MSCSAGPGLRIRGVHMRFFARKALIRLGSAAAICAALVSCNFNIDDDKGNLDPRPSVQWTEETLTKREVVLCKVFADGKLHSYEERYIKPDTVDTTRVIDQIKHFGASGTLLYVERFSISGDGTVVRQFRYTPEGKLVSSKAFEHEGTGDDRRLVRWYSFDQDGLFQSAYAYEWAEPVAGTVKIATVASFIPSTGSGGTGVKADSSVRWFFAPGSKTWNLEVRRGENSWQLGQGDPLSMPNAGADGGADFTESGRSVLEESVDPVLVVLPVPPVGDDSLKLVNCRLAWTDADGSSLITLEPVPADIPGGALYRPTSAERTDRRLGNSTVRTDLGYDDSTGRVVSKETYYGNTLALRIALAYDDDGFPTMIETTGAAMYAPLRYDIEWGSNKSLDRLELTVNDVLLQYFVFDYSVGDAPNPPLALSDLRSFDVFEFGDGIKNAISATGMTIKNYNWGNELQQTFSLSAVEGNTGFRAEVLKPDGASNGWYQIAYTSGVASSLGAYKPDGTALWSQSFGYAEDDIADFIDTLGLPDKDDLSDFMSDLGELYETWVPADLEQDLADVAAETASDPEGTVKKLEDQAVSAYASTEMGAIRMLFDFLL